MEIAHLERMAGGGSFDSTTSAAKFHRFPLSENKKIADSHPPNLMGESPPPLIDAKQNLISCYRVSNIH